MFTSLSYHPRRHQPQETQGAVVGVLVVLVEHLVAAVVVGRVAVDPVVDKVCVMQYRC